MASAATLEIGQYKAETRDLSYESRSLNHEARDLVGLDRGLEDTGSALNADAEDLSNAMTELAADETKTEIEVNLSADVLFDFDKFNIKPEVNVALEKVALIIAKKRKGNVIITGHTDSKGSDGYNQVLSQRRADSVRDWLMQKGAVSGDVLLTLGMGESEPVAANANADGSDNPEGRKLNRRVGIVIETK